MNNDKQLLIRIPGTLKDAIDKAACASNVSTSEYIRITLANSVAYTPPDKEPRRNRRFASKEERRQYYIARKREQRALARQLLEYHESL